MVTDDLGAHRFAGPREAVEAAGARVEYTPPYSPDINPVEQCWSKVKTFLRKAKAGTRELKEATLQITAADARAWFAHRGYPVY